MEPKKNYAGLIVAGVIVVLALGWYLWTVFAKPTAQEIPAAQNPNQVTAVAAPLTAADSTKKPTTPAQTFKAPAGTASILSYNLSAVNGSFVPNELVVAKSSRVQLSFKAVDGDYDLQIALPIGAYVTAKQGATAILGFDASKEGRYEISCVKQCPMGSMKGVIVIK